LVRELGQFALVKTDQAEGKKGTKFSPALGGRHQVGGQGIGAFHGSGLRRCVINY
jgi:hypothetical protein